MTVHDEKVDSGADDRYEELAELHAAPLWLYHTNLVPPEPRPTAVPAIWRYAELRPHLMHFLGALSLEDAERRVLMLVNPGMTDPPATTTSLYAGLQIIGPGETAQAHRHVANAFRYIMEGAGAYTTVNGERVHMSPGDLLLTPNWHWHDHHHPQGELRHGRGPRRRPDQHQDGHGSVRGEAVVEDALQGRRCHQRHRCHEHPVLRSCILSNN